MNDYTFKTRDEAEEAKWANYQPLGRDKRRHYTFDQIADDLQTDLINVLDRARETLVSKGVRLVGGDYAGREGTIVEVMIESNELRVVVDVTNIGRVKTRIPFVEFVR